MLWNLLEDAVLLWLLAMLAPAIAAVWIARRSWEGIAWARMQLAS